MCSGCVAEPLLYAVVRAVPQEDPFNAIMAGAATGGFLQLRAGLKPAFRSAVVGGVLLVSPHTAHCTHEHMWPGCVSLLNCAHVQH